MAQKNVKNPVISKPVQPVVEAKPFHIPNPVLWLIAAVVILYYASFSFGYTELDDTIFIRDLREYNEDILNLFTSFHRGVFDAVKDTYYRPLFLDSILINYRFSELEPYGYHIVNVLFHIVSVLLVFRLFRLLGIHQVTAFILSLLFAVHPVLSQAVAWIPGRNDTMLAIFTLSFLIATIKYTYNGNSLWLVLSSLFLLCAFFTKETAVFDAPVAFVIIIILLKKSWLDKRNMIQYGCWLLAFLIWLGVRSSATLQGNYLSPSKIAVSSIQRLPVVIQYLGKIFFPFNLSVFPILRDTVYYYGVAAILFLIAILLLAKNKSKRVIITGMAVFTLFLLPVLLVPNELNEQTFEHRLYLPIIGILMILPQTVLFKNQLKEKALLLIWLIIIIGFGIINFNHQKSFENPLAFWTEAAATSPHSSYAVMMLGARTKDKTKADELMRRAYALNPKEKYLNFYYGVMLQNHDSVLQSEKYLLTEKNTSGYYECDFYLARVAFIKNDLMAAQNYLEHYLTLDAQNPQANNNLLLLYMQTKQKANALQQIGKMQQIGQPVPNDVIAQAKNLP